MIKYRLVNVKEFKKPLTAIIVLVLILGLGYAFLQKENSLGLISSLNFNQEEVKGTAAICAQGESIEYLYYEKPKKEKNNKVGLYIYAEEGKFFDLAEELVNSNGGDWGYVLIPYNVRDRDRQKWNKVFNSLYERHLIPIVQLWDVDPDDYEDETKEAAEFLNSFIWPVRKRYISVYNEPNDAKFWRGSVDPKEYAQVLRYTIAVFKKENLDFFMINGALNTSASASNETMDAQEYMKRMNDAVPGIFNDLDGWASHPYPQPNFSGNPSAKGRWSIRAYEEELDFLKDELGLKKDLPVFITETGWAHAEGENYNSSYLSVDQVSEYIKYAYEKVWLPDDKVVAVTPFTVWYEPPFDHFSWVNRDRVPYKHYDAVKSIKKVEGDPEKLVVGRVTSSECTK